MTNKTYLISELAVVKKEKKQNRNNFSHVEHHLMSMNIGSTQDIIVSGSPMTGEYKVNTYLKVNDLCVKMIGSKIEG